MYEGQDDVINRYVHIEYYVTLRVRGGRAHILWCAQGTLDVRSPRMAMTFCRAKIIAHAESPSFHVEAAAARSSSGGILIANKVSRRAEALQ